MVKQVLFLTALVLFSSLSFAQVNEGLTAEERAYLYHVVKKSPILELEIGRYFDYKGPGVYLANKQPNYDSLETIIINQPELLIIRKEEIAKSSKGILSEAANKVAIWKLNKLLLAKRGSEKDLALYESENAFFDSLLMAKLPPNALKEKNGTLLPNPKLKNLLDPGLSLDDKIVFLESLRFLEETDQIVTLEAVHYAINAYVSSRALQMFRALGGQAEIFNNILVAAGDGSSTAGLLEEREKDEKGRWNKGLPKAIGLFPYQVARVSSQEKKKTTIEPLRIARTDLYTVGGNKETLLHFDVWGYNSKKQTTVVIERNGVNYHLFGSGDTRFLSPDSTFSDGTTFQTIINELERHHIAELDEMIHGRRGFDYWIDYNTKKKNETELKIIEKEKDFSDLGYRPVVTGDNPSRSMKKRMKKDRKAGKHPDSLNKNERYQPNTDANKKEKGNTQNSIVELYSLFNAYKKKIAELEQQKQEAVELRGRYQQKLDIYKQAMGFSWATFEEKDGLYVFSDSSTFDIRTQDFTFPATDSIQSFEVRLIAIPETALSEQADEVMLHMNLTDSKPQYDARVQIALNDQFRSDRWDLDSPLFSREDSVALVQFFEALQNKKTEFEIVARGQGVARWNGVRPIKDQRPNELSAYPISALDSSFSRLRYSELNIDLRRGILAEVNSFTDPVRSNIAISDPELLDAMSKYKLSKNDLLSALRTATILKKFKEEINVLAGTYLPRESAKIVIDRFNKQWSKTRVSVGATSFKLSELLK
ncbi:MAG: hypothetical protein RIT43_82 [Bacteroidota bacterium]